MHASLADCAAVAGLGRPEYLGPGPAGGPRKAAAHHDSKAEQAQVRDLVVLLRGAAQKLEPGGDASVDTLVQRLVAQVPTYPTAAAFISPLCPYIGTAALEGAVAEFKAAISSGETQIIRRNGAIGLAAVIKGL